MKSRTSMILGQSVIRERPPQVHDRKAARRRPDSHPMALSILRRFTAHSSPTARFGSTVSGMTCDIRAHRRGEHLALDTARLGRKAPRVVTCVIGDHDDRRRARMLHAVAVASISISKSGIARRVTPSRVLEGWMPAAPTRSSTTWAPSAKKRSTSVT